MKACASRLVLKLNEGMMQFGNGLLRKKYFSLCLGYPLYDFVVPCLPYSVSSSPHFPIPDFEVLSRMTHLETLSQHLLKLSSRAICDKCAHSLIIKAVDSSNHRDNKLNIILILN